MHNLSLQALSEQLHQRTLTSVALTQHFLDRIDQHDPQLNAFVTVTPELALEMARQADQRLDAGKGHRLTGIPIAHKDIFCTKDVKTTCGSKMLHNFLAPYDATVVEKCNALDMPILGKTNMDEFAMGSSTESSYYGQTRNPWDLNAVPGGSSGGSAAAVAAGLAPIATGSDTGGSIRQPASFCGISGIKPTYGSVSRYGMVAYASSFDQGGPMARSAQDTAWLLDAIAGVDERDSTSVASKSHAFERDLDASIAGMKVGVPEAYFSQGLDADVAKVVRTAIDALADLGAEIVPIALANKDLAVASYYVLAPAEASSNLSRYDGVRFGYRCDAPTDLNDLYTRSRSEGLGEEVKRRIMVGAYVLSEGYYDAYYRQAQKLRRMVRDDFVKAFEQCDLIVGPVAPSVAFDIGEKSDDPVSMYLADLYTIPVNLAGLPAMSVPAGFAQDRPVGLHIIGPYFEEHKVLQLAHQYQQVTTWHTQLAGQYR